MLARPEFRPDPDRSREAMESLQHDIAEAAVFADDLAVDPSRIRVPPATDEGGAGPNSTATPTAEDAGEPPLIAGVDQAFRDDQAVSAAVVWQDGEIVERAHAVEPVEIPYIPGLLAFREGSALLSALAALERDPDVLFVDGSGRIHYRQAGLATHVGVTVDVPALGVAKSLLCGNPRKSLEEPLPAGARVGIEADEEVSAPDGTLLGYAVQTRQFDSGDRHVNPVYVSPGHRVSAATAADLVLQCSAGYKLPEPIRAADRYAEESKRGE